MNEAAVLALINLHIVANCNNEITADVLRPILEAILEQPNDKVGELGDLDTTDKTTIVNAINELVSASGGGFVIHSGSADPNVTPPGSFGIGDWYVRNSSSLYQYNGSTWVLLSSAVTVSTDANNSLSLGTDDKPYFKERTAAEIATAYESNSNTNKYTDADKSAVGSAVQPEDLAAVATSGSYNDLADKPTIPGVPDEEDILGSVETNASVTGTKNLDMAAYSAFRYTLTGATTLTESGTPASGKSFVRNLLMTGNFALTYPASWTRKVGVYVGTKINLITVSYINVGGTLNVDVVITQMT